MFSQTIATDKILSSVDRPSTGPVPPDLDRHRPQICKRQSAVCQPGRTAFSGVHVSDSQVSVSQPLQLLYETAVSALLIPPAALAQDPAGKVQGSSAASDLLLKKSKKAVSLPEGSASTPPASNATSSNASVVESAPSPAPATSSLEQAASNLSDSTSDAAGQASSTISRLQDSASTSGGSLKEGASDLANTVQSSTGPALKPPSIQYPSGSSPGAVADDVSKQAGDAAAQLSKQANEAAENLSKQAQGALQDFSSAAGDASAGARDALSGVGEDVSAALQQLGGQLGEAASSAKASLPAPVQQAIDAVTPVVDSAVHQIQSDSRLATAAAALGIGLPVLLWFRARYGGYGGPLSASETFAVLQEEDAAWVDLRSEEQREADGVAELKRGARRKGVLVPFATLPLEVSRQLRKPNEVAAQMTAVQIASLKQVNGSTKIILVDDRGKDAIRVARTLGQFGRAKAFVLEGGFKAWVRQGYPVREGSLYGTSVLETFSEDVEVFAENANAFVRNPAALVALLAAIGGTGAAVYDYHKALQFVGVFGLLVTAIWRYNSMKELTEDLLGGIKNLGKAADTVATTVPAIAAAGSSALSSASSSLSSETSSPYQDSGPPVSRPQAASSQASSQPSSQPSTDSAEETADEGPVPEIGNEEESSLDTASQSNGDGSQNAAAKAQPLEEKRMDDDASKVDEATPVPSESMK